MNKEYSVLELKGMLQDAEKVIRLKVSRIKELEAYIVKLEAVCNMQDHPEILNAKKRLENTKKTAEYVQQLEAAPDTPAASESLAESALDIVNEGAADTEINSSDSEGEGDLDSILRMDSEATNNAPIELKTSMGAAEPSSLELKKVVQDNEKLDPRILKTETETDLDDKRIDEEI